MCYNSESGFSKGYSSFWAVLLLKKNLLKENYATTVQKNGPVLPQHNKCLVFEQLCATLPLKNQSELMESFCPVRSFIGQGIKNYSNFGTENPTYSKKYNKNLGEHLRTCHG